MEHKEKHRVYAHTFIPSVERLDHNPSLIQLASKARDSSKLLNCVDSSKLGFKHGFSRKITPDHSPSPFPVVSNKTEKTTKVLTEANGKIQVKENLSKNGRQMTENDHASSTLEGELVNTSPKISNQDLKYGSHGSLATAKSPQAKSVSPYGDRKHATSISACTYTPKSASSTMETKSLSSAKVITFNKSSF